MNDIIIDKVKVTNSNTGEGGFYNMFKNCTNLETVNMSVTSSGMGYEQQTLAYMFNGCTNLNSVYFKNIDFYNIQQFKGIFNNCNSFTKDCLIKTMSNWDYDQNDHLFSDANHKAGFGWNSLFEKNKCNATLKTGSKQKIEITINKGKENEKLMIWEIDGTYRKQDGHQTRLNYWKDE